MYIVGCMTGTSLDGIDVALVEFDKDSISPRFISHLACYMPKNLQKEFRHLAEGGMVTAYQMQQTAIALGDLHVTAIQRLLSQKEVTQKISDVSFIVAHGQTIWHEPEKSVTFQLLEPHRITHVLKVPVLYDLRQADVAGGGQGAPITPRADLYLYGKPNSKSMVVNLGGICNVTVVDCKSNPQNPSVSGGDIGPCNLLLDRAFVKLFPNMETPYDKDGANALLGSPTCDVFSKIKEHPFYSGNRSTGREDFSEEWVDSILSSFPAASNSDLLSSCVHSIAQIISDYYQTHCPGSVTILCGGGAKNKALHKAVAARVPSTSLSEDFGIPSEAREAICFAILGRMAATGQSYIEPSVTQGNGLIGGVWAGLDRKTVFE